MKKIILSILATTTIALGLVGCSEANTVSKNLSTSADNFEVERRIVFLNGITDKYLLSIEGRCSFDAESSKKVSVTCKVGDNQYKKHTLGLSDNVTFFSEQTDAKYENPYHYKVVLRPETIVPDIEVKTSKGNIDVIK